MITYVLDASAALRYIDNESGWQRMEEILADGVHARAELCVSAVQWGEIAGKLCGRLGAGNEMPVLNDLLLSDMKIIPADGESAVRAARLKVARKISYADAFALDLALQFPGHMLVTADYGFKAVEDMARIEFLPAK